MKELKDLLIKFIREGRRTLGKVQENDTINGEWPQANFAFKE